MRKPDNIIYGTEDRPPALALLALAVQHMLVLSIFLVAPVIVAKTAHLPNRQAANFISLTMIALAIATVLQVRRWGPIGCGLLTLRLVLNGVAHAIALFGGPEIIPLPALARSDEGLDQAAFE